MEDWSAGNPPPQKEISRHSNPPSHPASLELPREVVLHRETMELPLPGRPAFRDPEAFPDRYLEPRRTRDGALPVKMLPGAASALEGRRPGETVEARILEMHHNKAEGMPPQQSQAQRPATAHLFAEPKRVAPRTNLPSAPPLPAPSAAPTRPAPPPSNPLKEHLFPTVSSLPGVGSAVMGLIRDSSPPRNAIVPTASEEPSHMLHSLRASQQRMQEEKALRLSTASRLTVTHANFGAVADVLDRALELLIEKRRLIGEPRVGDPVATLDFDLEERVWEAMELCHQSVEC